jgi:hypothetical protein
MRDLGLAESAALGSQLTPVAKAYVHFHFPFLLARNPHLRGALAMDADDLAALIRENEWRWAAGAA